MPIKNKNQILLIWPPFPLKCSSNVYVAASTSATLDSSMGVLLHSTYTIGAESLDQRWQNENASLRQEEELKEPNPASSGMASNDREFSQHFE